MEGPTDWGKSAPTLTAGRRGSCRHQAPWRRSRRPPQDHAWRRFPSLDSLAMARIAAGTSSLLCSCCTVTNGGITRRRDGKEGHHGGVPVRGREQRLQQ
jgi:hypothetical protein